MSQRSTDSDVRNAVAFIPVTSIGMEFSDQEAVKFDRWLARHDAEVSRKALEDAADAIDGFAERLESYQLDSGSEQRAVAYRQASSYLRRPVALLPENQEEGRG